MSLVKLEVSVPAETASVLTTESVGDPGLQVGDQVRPVVKAVHDLTVKE